MANPVRIICSVVLRIILDLSTDWSRLTSYFGLIKNSSLICNGCLNNATNIQGVFNWFLNLEQIIIWKELLYIFGRTLWDKKKENMLRAKKSQQLDIIDLFLFFTETLYFYWWNFWNALIISLFKLYLLHK